MRIVNDCGRTAILCLRLGVAAEMDSRDEEDADPRRERATLRSSVRLEGEKSTRLLTNARLASRRARPAIGVDDEDA
jgi:hypothetical protein